MTYISIQSNPAKNSNSKKYKVQILYPIFSINHLRIMVPIHQRGRITNQERQTLQTYLFRIFNLGAEDAE